MNIAAEIVGWIITIVAIVYVFKSFSNLERRLRRLEANKPAGKSSVIGVDAMEAVDNVTAMMSGLRRQLINHGFSPEAADALVVHTIQGAANQGGKK